MVIRRADVVIIGSGLAGLMAAEILSADKNVIIITKSKFGQGNSKMAQGGIAAAVSKEDDWRDHFFDTVIAGGYHNDLEITKKLVQRGPLMIEKLISLGVQFDEDENGDYALGQEGAHGKRRILHAGGDATGKELVSVLMERVRKHATIYENEMAIDLLVENGRCIGVVTQTNSGERQTYITPHTVLATGGAGQLFQVTSNCDELTGDGMAMAFRAGAELTDMEFVQFHPTMLVKKQTAFGLISEAVRGEGAKLVTENGDFIMEGIHEMKDLAPRDVVARTIHQTLQTNKELFLDISSISNFRQRFPSITEICNRAEVDVEKGKIPVAPGAHFIMGGVAVNGDGKTSLEGLFAIGEVAQTGVHGANRLASNSLLEAIVFANELAASIMRHPLDDVSYAPSETSVEVNIDNLPTIMEIKEMMTNYVGIVRDGAGLQIAKRWFEQFLPIIYQNKAYQLTNEQKTICNLLTLGCCITNAAISRTESRGGHYRVDYPTNNDRKWLGVQLIHTEKSRIPYKRRTKQEHIIMSV